MYGYILRPYDNGFHRRNGGFLKNGIAVSYARTAGTREPEYSGLEIPLDQKSKIFNMLKWAYGITDEQPLAISKKLANENVNYRLINGKWNSGERRNKSYWKFVSIEEFNVWLTKQQKE